MRRIFRAKKPHLYQRPLATVFSAERERDPSTPVVLPSVVYTVDSHGNVTYYADKAKTQPILLDTGSEVQVVDQALESVETGLRLALQKFGPALDVHGDPHFKAQVLGVVLRTGLRVQFKDPALAAKLERMQAPPLQAPQVPEAIEDYRKTEEWIEAEYAGEIYDFDDDEPGDLWTEKGAVDMPPQDDKPARVDTSHHVTASSVSFPRAQVLPLLLGTIEKTDKIVR